MHKSGTKTYQLAQKISFPQYFSLCAKTACCLLPLALQAQEIPFPKSVLFPSHFFWSSPGFSPLNNWSLGKSDFIYVFSSLHVRVIMCQMPTVPSRDSWHKAQGHFGVFIACLPSFHGLPCLPTQCGVTTSGFLCLLCLPVSCLCLPVPALLVL